MIKNIMIVGVGGQGTLLASKILGAAAFAGGYDVKISEVHGMSQRGGSVVTYVRYGESVSSPVICRGEADVIIAFELLEAARWLPYLKKDGIIIANTQQLNPMPVITGAAVYPGALTEKISGTGAKLIAADAYSEAVAAGTDRAVNIVLLGVFASIWDFDRTVFTDGIKNTVAPKFVDINLNAFERGYSLAK